MRSPQSFNAAAERVLPISLAISGSLRFAQGADHLVCRRKPGARDAVRDHEGIAEDRRAVLQRIARGTDEAGREFEMPGGLHQAAGMHHPHGKIGLLFGKPGKIGFTPDDGERTLVDGVAVCGYNRIRALLFLFDRSGQAPGSKPC